MQTKASWKCNQGGLTDVTKAQISGTTLLLVACMNGDVLTFPSSLSSPSGPPSRLPVGHNAPTSSVDCCPVDKAVISGGCDNKINQFTVDKDGSFDPVRTIVAHFKPVNCVRWSPDGSSFASGSQDHYLKTWDPRSPHKKPTTSVNTGQPVFTLSWHKKQPIIATGNEEGVRLYDLRKLETPLASNIDFANSVKSVQFSPNSVNLLAVGADDGQTCVFDTSAAFEATPKSQLKKIYTHQHTDFVRTVSWNPEKEGEYLVGGGWGRIEALKVFGSATDKGTADLLNVHLHKFKSS